MTSREELKPCPFCGGEAKCNGHPKGIMGQIFCSNDDCFGPKTTALTREESVKQWNTRASAQPSQDLLNSRATAAPLGTWSYRVTANGFYELWQETEAGPHYAGQVNSLPSAETICERLNELPPALALPPQDGDKAQNQLAGSERLGPQYDGTRSITSSPMVARHHEASDEAPCTSSPQGRKPEAAALIEAAIEAARASKTALGYDATKVQQLGRFTMANWKHIEKLWTEPPQGSGEPTTDQWEPVADFLDAYERGMIHKRSLSGLEIELLAIALTKQFGTPLRLQEASADTLSFGMNVSSEQLDEMIAILDAPDEPSEVILQGQELLRSLRPKR